MKTTKITYFVSTGLLSLLMAFSMLGYLTNPEIKEGFHHLGFPDYFRVELAIAKGLAAIAIWLLFLLVKESGYIGLTICFLSAVIAHLSISDPTATVLTPLIILGVTMVSYISNHKLTQSKVDFTA